MNRRSFLQLLAAFGVAPAVVEAMPVQTSEDLMREFCMGMHTPNDLRRMRGLPPIDEAGMDARYVMANMGVD